MGPIVGFKKKKPRRPLKRKKAEGRALFCLSLLKCSCHWKKKQRRGSLKKRGESESQSGLEEKKMKATKLESSQPPPPEVDLLPLSLFSLFSHSFSLRRKNTSLFPFGVRALLFFAFVSSLASALPCVLCSSGARKSTGIGLEAKGEKDRISFFSFKTNLLLILPWPAVSSSWRVFAFPLLPRDAMSAIVPR